ncbi:hypothetical protein T09_10562, partial [Trichinella sp. T9]
LPEALQKFQTTSTIWFNLCLAHFYGIMLLTNTEILIPGIHQRTSRFRSDVKI